MKQFLFILAILCITVTSSAQLTLDQDITPQAAAQQLVGAGVAIDNVVVTAADSSWAYYYNSSTELPATEGLMLTTGKARNAVITDGVNGTGLPELQNQTICLNCDEFDNDFPGSALLNTVNDRNTFDATTFEFDVKVQGDSLSFDFTFASEEYEEWVGSSFNDVFGFFITGPGGFNDVNIALIPGTNEPVAINSVNNVFNSQYYYDNRNPLGQNVQYDGFTLGLKAEVGNLIPCETYTLKLIIADGTDRLYDSAVFIEKLSSNFSDIETATDGGTPYMIEGCNDGIVTFIADEVMNVDQNVLYSFGGTADILTDYTTSPSFGDNTPGVQQSITIPANQESVSIDVQPIDDGIIEGDEFITLYIINTVCDVDIQDSIQFVIKDSLELSVIPQDIEVCSGEQVTLEGISDTNGDFTFSWDPPGEVDSPNSIITTTNPTTTTVYTLTSNLSSCIAQASTTISVKEIDIDVDITSVNCSGAAIGEIDVTISNAAIPYTVTWTDSDDDFLSNDEDLTGLGAGAYTITVIDADGCEESITVIVNEENTLVSNLILSDFNGSTISCNGTCDGTALVAPSGGQGPYTITWSEPVPQNTVSLSNLCPGNYSVTIEDSNGCIITDNFTISEPAPLEGSVVSVSEILCNGTSSGEASVTASGGIAPYFYSWSDDPSGTPVLGQGPTLSNLGDGTYYVTVTDANGCEADNSVEVTVLPPPPPISISLSALLYGNGFNTTCFDLQNGQITAIVSGGSPGYTYVWTDENETNVGSGIVLIGVGCGEYTVTITDQNGCVESETIEIICPPQISATFAVTPNPCNDPLATDGAIDLTPSGGTGMGYSYSWVDQNSVDFGNSEDLSNLPSGIYSVTITDSDGCDRTIDIPVTNELNILVTVNQLSDNSCFESCDGVIDIDIANTIGGYTVEWSTLDGVFSNSEDLTGLCADTYFLVVTANDGCQATEEYTITQPSEIVIDIIEVIDPTCAGQNSGSIDISVSGGDGPLSTEWEPLGIFTGSTDEDIQQLLEGTYTVNVTDASNMCVATQQVTLTSPQAIDLDIQLSSYDGGFFTSCADESDGQLTAAASGGNPDFDNLPFGYFYDWSNLPAGNDPSLPNQINLPGGTTYGLVVTDTAGCQVEILIPTLEPDVLESAETITPITCNGLDDGTITPNITGGSGNYISYNWTGDIGSNDVDAVTLTDLSPGMYSLEVFDSNGCTFVKNYEVTEPDILEAVLVSITQEDCFGSSTASVTVDGDGGTPTYTFDWLDEDMNVYSGATLTNIDSGEYYLTVTDDNGCVALDTIDINSDEVFTLNLNLFQVGTGIYTLACLGDENGSAEALVNGGIPDYTYVWTDEVSTVIGNNSTISDLGVGKYYIDVSDLSGCMITDSITITEPLTEFTAQADITSPIGCFDDCTGEIEITANGGDLDYTYLWEVNEEELDFGAVADELCAGDYEVLVVDANGCDTLIDISLNQPPEIVLDITLSNYIGGFNVSCFGAEDGQISTVISGGIAEYTIEWTGDIGSNDLDSDTLFNIGAGTYTLSVTDLVDCMVDSIISVIEPDTLQIEEIITPISCFDDDNAIIDANPTGGSGNYNFVWGHIPDDVQTTGGLNPGSYSVTVTDENGCEAFEEFDITEPDLLTASATSTASTCGQPDGSIDLTPLGGVDPYTFNWDNGADDVEDPQNLAGGLYTVIVEDENGCTLQLPVNVNISEGIVIGDVTITDVLCFGDENGCIEVAIDSSNGDVQFTWTDPSGEAVSPCDAPAGTYAAAMVDEAGCENSGVYIIASPDSIDITLLSPEVIIGYNISVFGGSDGSIATEVVGGTPDYNYSWSGPDNFSEDIEDLSDLSAGVYTLIVTDENGCEQAAEIEVIEPSDLTLPTGLTPNQDGFNDGYVILGLDQYDRVAITVYNRWGNSVYSNDSYTNNWVGRNDNGDDLANGTYYVVVVATRGSETKELNSFVDLRR